MSLTKKAIDGSKWNVLSITIRTVIQFAQMVLLAKFLNPKDYGLVGMMSFFIGLSSVLVDMGLSSAIIHAKDITRNQLSSLFWLNVLLGLVIFLLITASSPLIAMLYDEPQIKEMIIYMALGLFMNSFSFQHQFLLLKDLRFKESSLYTIISQVLLLVISLSMAILDYGVYSLIIPNIIVSALGAVYLIYYLREHYLPQFHFSYSDVKRFMKYSFYLTASNLLNYFNSQVDTLLIGYYVGAERFGYYYVAKNLSLRPLQIMAPIISNVTGPLLSKVNTEAGRLYSAYSKIIHYSSLLLFPTYLLMFLFAKPIIEVLYGDRWLLAIFPLQLMCIISIFRSLISPIGSLVLATGKARELFVYNVVLFILFPASMFLGSYYGIEGILYAQVALMVLFLFLHVFIVLKPLIPEITVLNYFSFFSNVLFLNLALFVPTYLVLTFVNSSILMQFSVIVFYAIGFLFLNVNYNKQFLELLSHFNGKKVMLLVGYLKKIKFKE